MDHRNCSYPGLQEALGWVDRRTLSTSFMENTRDKAKAMVLQTGATWKPLRFGGPGQVSKMPRENP